MKKKLIIISIVAAVIIAAGVGYYIYTKTPLKQTEAADKFKELSDAIVNEKTAYEFCYTDESRDNYSSYCVIYDGEDNYYFVDDYYGIVKLGDNSHDIYIMYEKDLNNTIDLIDNDFENTSFGEGEVVDVIRPELEDEVDFKYTNSGRYTHFINDSAEIFIDDKPVHLVYDGDIRIIINKIEKK